MVSFIAIPLKKTYDIDLVKPLKDVISNFYSTNDDPEELKQALSTLNKMRANCTAKTMDVRSEGSLEMLEKYYDQLSSLEAKCPPSDISFKWKDAFDRGGSFFLSSSSLTIPNVAYEKVCILFNIGAIQSQLASTYGNEGINNDESLRLSAKYFQGASGVFQALKHTASSAVGSHELSTDMQNEILNFLQALMLAQAQETFFHKAANGNMKEAVISKIANQCEEHYSDVQKQMKLIKFSWPDNWGPIIAMKQLAFHGIAEYYQSIVALQKKDFGEQIARLTKGIESLKGAEAKGGVNFLQLFKDHLSKSVNSLEEAKKDNDFIYHARIPEYKTLPSIGKAELAKPSSIPQRFRPESGDLFEKLLPVGVQNAAQKLEARKQEIVNAEVASIREMSQTLNAILASLNLPAAIEDTSGVEVPHSVRDKANAVIAKGGIEAIEKFLSELPDLLQRNKEILDETERVLQSEEESDDNLRAQFKERWTRTPSSKLNQNWKEHIAKYKHIIQNAIEADNKIKQKYNAHKAKIELLSSTSEATLANALPSANGGSVGVQNSPIVAELKRLMSQVEAIKNEREVIEAELKNANFNDMKSKFLNALIKDGAINELALSTEAIGEVYGPLQKQIRESNERQQTLIAEVQSANEQFVRQKGSASVASQREVFLSELASAHDAFMDLHSNLHEGTKFYNDLTQLLVNLQTKIEDFCFARKAEREELCKDMQNEIVSRPTPPAPSTPAYHSESGGAARGPPPRPPPPATAPQQQQPMVPPSQGTQPVYPFSQPYAANPNPYQQQYYYPPPLPAGYNPYAVPQQMPPQMPQQMPYSQMPSYPMQSQTGYPYPNQAQPTTGYPQYPYPQQRPSY